MSLRPHNDWILVRTEPLPERSGSLFLPDKGRVYTAEVLAVGPGKLTKKGVRTPPQVRPGERIAFLRWHLEHQQGKQVVSVLEELGADLALIKEPDILFVVPTGETVRIEA